MAVISLRSVVEMSPCVLAEVSSRRSVDGTVNINVEVREQGDASPPTAKIKIAHIDPEAEIEQSTLRSYCVDFQECA